MYCIKCGTRLSDDSLFCHACGAKVVREIPPKGQEKMEAPVNTPPEPVNNSTKSNTEEVQEEKKNGWKNWLLNGFLIIFFLIASAIGKQLGRATYKSYPHVFEVITGSLIVSIIPYFLVKKYGKWDNNDAMSWIFAIVCFIAQFLGGLFFSVPLILVMAFIVYMKRR